MDVSTNTPTALPMRRRPRRLEQFLIWARKVGLGVKAEIMLAIAALVSAVATFSTMSADASPFAVTSTTVRILMIVNLILLSVLAVLVARRLINLWAAQRSGSAGSKLQGRMARLFGLVAIGPPVTMAIFAFLFFELGVQNWFSQTVRSTLQSSLDVAEAYVEEHRRVIRADILAMAGDLNKKAALLGRDPAQLQLEVEGQAAARALSEAVVFDGGLNVLAKAAANLSLVTPGLPATVMQRVRENELVILSDTDDDRVSAFVKLENYFDTFLFVSRFVDSRVLGHVESARASVADYEALEGQRSVFQLSVNLIFIIVAVLIVVAAMWIGLAYASRLVAPIGRLVEAAEDVRQGKLDARVPATDDADEIGTLSRTFNRMTEQLSEQRRDLMQANQQLDERRRFSEAVLSGVSAGVIGLSPKGTITLPNLQACVLLGVKEELLTGQNIAQVVPEMAGLFKSARRAPGKPAQGQVIVAAESNDPRTLLVRISAVRDEDVVTGYVVTFDDVTEQVADQRTAAWADVARRIAHEIKNPLTPIQLSAERLKRKYSGEIQSDPSVFEQCTDTIIRQVGDLRHMVNEFSSFARMPTPAFRIEDITDVVRKAVFLQEIAHPEIAFSLGTPDHKAQLICDGRLIAQAVTNLLKNSCESILGRVTEAAECGEKGEAGVIDVRVESEATTTRIIVEDNGFGLPEDMITRLTEPYVTTRNRGTGLGLAIVKKVMEDHAGSLILENRADSGARAVMFFDHDAVLKRVMDQEKAEQAAGDGDAETVAEAGVGEHGA